MQTRSRRIHRLIIRASLLLLLGAIVNVAVAWGCVCWGPVATRSGATEERAPWRAAVPNDWATEARQWRESSWAISEYWSWALPGAAMSRPIVFTVQWTAESGVPLRSMFVERHRAESAGASYNSIEWDRPSALREGITIPDWVPWTRFNRITRCLPTQILWPGFAVNTVFYATILWLMLAAPFALRRRLRARRGQCQACGYPIGVSPVCTECGAALPASSATRLASRHE